MTSLFALQAAALPVASDSIMSRAQTLRAYEEFVLAHSSVDWSRELKSFASVNLEDAVMQFDAGVSFYGSFEASQLALQQTSVEEVEASIRRHLHLLVQLCLVNTQLLESLFNLYGSAVSVVDPDADPWGHLVGACSPFSPRPTEAATAAAPAGSARSGDSAGDSGAASADAMEVEASPVTANLPALMCKLIESELNNVLMSVQFPVEQVLSNVLRCDPLARKLVIIFLECSHSNLERPATAETVRLVHLFHDRCLQYRAMKAFPPLEPVSIVEVLQRQQMAPAASASPSAMWSREAELSALALHEMLAPVLSAFPSSELVDRLPMLVKYGLRVGAPAPPGSPQAATATAAAPRLSGAVASAILGRMVRSRPPPLARSSLLAALHRWVGG
jgi:hypothetical protein